MFEALDQFRADRTAVTADRKWPDNYGVVGDYVPEGFLKQQVFPFRPHDKP